MRGRGGKRPLTLDKKKGEEAKKRQELFVLVWEVPLPCEKGKKGKIGVSQKKEKRSTPHYAKRGVRSTVWGKGEEGGRRGSGKRIVGLSPEGKKKKKGGGIPHYHTEKKKEWRGSTKKTS